MADYNKLADDKGNVNEGGIFLLALRWGIGLIVLGLAFWIISMFLGNGAIIATQKSTMRAEQAQQVLNGQHSIGTDHWYLDKYNAIVASVANIKVSKDALDEFDAAHKGQTLSYTQEQARTQMGTDLAGQKMALNSDIGEYNSKSDQWSENIFMSDKLPRKIDPNNPPTTPLAN